MSSSHIRQAIKTFIEANTSETLVDLTGHFEDLREMLEVSGVAPDAPWLGIDFVS